MARSTKLLEKDIENIILTWLNQQCGVFAFKVKTTGFFDTKRKVFRKNLSKFIIPGTSDILGVVKDGRMLALEVKTPLTIRRFNNCPTDADKRQQRFIDQVTAYGGIAGCVSSLQDVQVIFIRERLI